MTPRPVNPGRGALLTLTREAAFGGAAMRCALLVTIGMLCASPAARPADPLAFPIQLTHSQNFDPSFAPDGKRIVYVSLIAGREELVISNPDGDNPLQISHDSADHEDPAWSPDGKLIAYTYISKNEERIFVMQADGTGAHAISAAGKRTIHPEWSADSTRVIYCTDDDLAPPRKNNADILVTTLSSMATVTLITGGINTYPTWSPDMKHLAFRKIIGEENSEVFIADGDGTHLRNLTNNPFFDGWPAWSPDGQKIAFASNRRGHGYQIFLTDLAGSVPQLVANTEGRGTAPRWAPDGKSIYFTNCQSKDYGVDC